MQKIIFLTAGGSAAIATRLLAKPGTICGEVLQEAFPDHEIHQQLVTPIGYNEAVVVGNFNFSDADATFELFDIASLVVVEGAFGLTVVSPESRGKTRQELFLQRVQVRMLSAIPETAMGNRFIQIDPQSTAMPFYDKPVARRQAAKPISRRAAIDLFESRGKPVLLATKSYGYMLKQFEALADFEAGVCFRDKAGIVTAVGDSVAGRDVVIIGGTIDHTETLDLYVLANAVFEADALSMTIVIPYFGYSTMERGKPELHEAVKAAYRARLLSSIPLCPLGNRIVLNDLHSEGIPQYFSDRVRTSHVYSVKRIIMDMVKEKDSLNGRICTTDAGRGKWAESLVKDINRGLKARGVSSDLFWQAAFALKDRKSGSETELLGVLGDVAGRDIDLFDDMIRRGTTAIEAAVGYRNGSAGVVGSGCKKIRFVASHGIFPDGALERLRTAVDLSGEPLFNEVIVSDSHPNAVRLADDFLKVRPISHILVEQVLQLLARGA
ncbi:hypothetical protein BH10CYA1_BH10CYA1_17800 [soil metagenome]